MTRTAFTQSIDSMLLMKNSLLFAAVAIFSAATLSTQAAEIGEDFIDGEFNLPSPYIGSKSSVVLDGTNGSTGSLKTIFDANGHGNYVVSFKVPDDVQGQTLYYSYDMKTDDATALSGWSSKHLKFRANNSDGCYWNTTVRWDVILYGGGNCERDTGSNIFASDSNSSPRPWRTGDIDIVVETGGAVKFTNNVWYNWVVMVKSNDLGSTNGELKMWLNGELYWHIRDIDFRASSMDWHINTIDLGGYTSGNPGATAIIWVDNIAVSNEPLLGVAPANNPIAKMPKLNYSINSTGDL